MLNSVDTGTSQTSLQAKDGDRPEVLIQLRHLHTLSLSVIDFIPADSAFFFRVARPDGFGEKECFIRIRTVPAFIVVSEGESEFLSSLKEELWRSRILRLLYSNGLGNQRVRPSHIIWGC
ncbi:hypothetical protein AVEN_127701-1 [Araneus ventricosus]|uniref:Uncharacterized protein n=1 Tax=Araneus ventricosus TaxID=182803 RepID=A0A4Y2SHS0_ARAVE|nr:hypothetical protein AVEN_127701-1 [Araneus ventricosus]